MNSGARALLAELGHAFRDPALLEQALTHPSYAHEHPPAAHNETLAFLGDAVLGLVVAEILWHEAPAAGPGPLSQRRAELVSARNLGRWALRAGLPTLMRLGRGETRGGGQLKESVLATALEAVLGALYLDGGLGPVRAWIAAQIRRDDGAAPASGGPGGVVG